MSTTPEMTDLFRFTELRAPYSPEAKPLRQNYIRDDFIRLGNDGSHLLDPDFELDTSPSVIGHLVYEQVFCKVSAGTVGQDNENLISTILALLTPYEPTCSTVVAKPLAIADLERRAYIQQNGLYYLLPERLNQIE